MSNIDGKSSSNPVKDGMQADISHSKEKVFVISNKRHIIDEDNQEHPWYLFPEEDMDDVSEMSDSNSSYTTGDEEEQELENSEREPFKKQVSLVENIKIEEEEDKLHNCTICGKIYKKKGHLERHQLKHSGEDRIAVVQKIHQCEECGYQATRTGNFKKHLLTHSGERPFSCHLCEKSFRQKVHLKDHVRSHTGVRDFECVECGATFVQKSSLNLHERKHSGVRPYSCKLCGRSFFENQHLVNHMRTHTGEKPYQCETCGQTFSTFRTLKTHKMIHTGERPYKCEVCGISFREKATLQKHRGVHINVGPFPCTECGKEFTRLASLSLHKKIHLQIGPNVPVHCGTSTHGYTVRKSKIENKVFNEENTSQMMSERGNQVDVLKEQNVFHDSDCEDMSNVSMPSQLQEKSKDVISLNKSKMLLTASGSEGESPLNTNFCKSGSNRVKKNSHDRKTPRKSTATVVRENIAAKSPEKMTCLENVAHPDHVRQALEFGTIWETKDEDGNDLIVVLPAILSNRELILTSQNNETILPLQNPKPSSLKSLPAVSGFKSSYEIDLPKEEVEIDVPVSEEIIHKFPKPDVSSKSRVVDLTLDEGGDSSDEADLDIEIFTSSSVDDEPLHAKSAGGYEGRIIQEDVHSENTGLLLWDDDMGPVTEVTYVIEEGHKDPVSIFHNNVTQSDDVKVIPLKAKRKRGAGDDKEFLTTDIQVIRKRRKREVSSSDEKRKFSRRAKERKMKPKRIFKCNQCGKTCKSSSNFISHMRTHSGERPYFCDVCGVGFKQIAHLRSHVRIHTGEKPFVCDICGAAFTQSSRLNSHKRSRHVEGESRKVKKKIVRESKIKNFYCPICQKTFLGECFKRDHMQQHRMMSLDHDSIKSFKASSDFQCDVCGIVYSNKATFNKHRLQHSDNKLICEVCGCSFANISALQSHSMVMHGVKMEADAPGMYINVKIGKEEDFIVVNPSVKCVLNGNNNYSAAKGNEDRCDDLNDHKTPVIQLTETSDGHVKSEVMSGSEFHDEELNDMRVVHVNQGVKDEPITEVDSNSFDSTNVNEYIEAESSLKSSDINDYLMNESLDDKSSINRKARVRFDYVNSDGKKVWECKLCNKIFFQSSNLHCHMRSHTGEKPYKCNICPKAFKQITHLKEHMHKHTGMKSFGCTTCGAHFTQRGAVKRHIKVIHNGDGNIENVKSFSEKKKSVISNNGSLFVRRRSTKPKEKGLPLQSLKMEGCDLCGKRYHPSYLKSHRRCHTGEKPFKCRFCSELFRQKAHLTSHLVRHTGKRPFVCIQCGASYMQSMRLKKHKEKCVGKATGICKKKVRFNDMEMENIQEDEGSDVGVDDNGIDKSSPEKEDGIAEIPVSVKMLHRKQLKTHEEDCDSSSSSSDSDVSNDSDNIPYQDESDEEIVLTRKYRRKKGEKNEGESPLPKKDNARIHSIKSNIISKDTSRTVETPEMKNSERSFVCKVCGAAFRRNSALNFHFKMKHENVNDDVSEDDTEEENLRICSEDEQVERGTAKSRTDFIKTRQKNDGKLPKRRKGKSEKVVEELEKDDKYCGYQKKRQIGRRKVCSRGKHTKKTRAQSYNVVHAVESVDKLKFCCVICNLNFEEASLLESHIETEHSGKITKTKGNKKQRGKVGSSTKTDFLCALDLSDKCDSSEEQRKLVLSDTCKLSVLNKEDKSDLYVCAGCGKSFTRSSKLKHHAGMCKGKDTNSASPADLSK